MLFLLAQKDPTWLRRLLNQYQPEAIHLSSDQTAIAQTLEKLTAQSLVRSKKRQTSKDLSHRYRELDVLAGNLEKLVDERTQWIESSNREQRELIRLDRRFLQFLIEMGLQRSREDAFEVLVKEFRQLQLADQVYLLQQGRDQVYFSTRLGAQSLEFNWPGVWWNTREIENLSENCSRQLSAKLARPVGRLVAFPFSDAWAVVVERAAKGPLAESEFATIKKHVQTLGLTLEKIRLEDDSRLTALRWEKVFDRALDPIAIVTQDYQLLRSNDHFGDFRTRQKCFELFAKRQLPCENCPISKQNQKTSEVIIGDRTHQVFSYPVDGDSPVYLHRYVDITEKQKRHVLFLQNEKLSSIGQIAELMAHEIYNPLAGILALVEILLSDKKITESVRSDLLEIQKAAVRAQKVIENLQDFVSRESEVVSITLDEIIDKTLPLLKMKWRSYKLQMSLAAKTKKIKVQPQLISQVVYNLIQNACQAMVPGKILTLKTFETENFVQLQVIDQGEGIPDTVKPYLFKPFFTTKPTGEGTGLGLSLSKQFVERFGGQLSFQSEMGQGTTFTMELPIE